LIDRGNGPIHLSECPAPKRGEEKKAFFCPGGGDLSIFVLEQGKKTLYYEERRKGIERYIVGANSRRRKKTSASSAEKRAELERAKAPAHRRMKGRKEKRVPF